MHKKAEFFGAYRYLAVIGVILITCAFAPVRSAAEDNSPGSPETVSMYYYGTYLSMGKDNQPHLIPFYWQGTTKSDLSVPEGTSITYLKGISAYNNTAYTVGYYCTAGLVSRACYWQGTTRIDLPLPEDALVSSANAITIVNGTIYIAGYYVIEGAFIPCYWQGSERIDLSIPDGETSYTPYAICVADGMVYTSGCYQDPKSGKLQEKGGTVRPCYWQGTTRVDLSIPDGIKEIKLSSFKVVEGTAYTTAYYKDMLAEKPCYWEGSTRVDLPIPDITMDKFPNISMQTGCTSSIAVYDGTVYTSGFYSEKSGLFKPCYWQGTERIDLPLPAGAVTNSINSQIAVDGGTVYITGGYRGNKGAMLCYWQGTTRVDLPAPGLPAPGASTNISSISVINGTVYIGSYYGGSGSLTSCYWQGAEIKDLGSISVAGFSNPGITGACMVVK